MMYETLNRFSFKENRRRYLHLKGISSRRYAYKGPDVVQIDLTDNCTGNCLPCWAHSPFIKNNKNADTEELDFSTLKGFITDIAKWGAKEIIFSGGGEPFLYSKIWEILEFTQAAGLIFHISTNFILLNKKDISRLSPFNKLASLTTSIWSADPDLYSKLHNRPLDEFYKVKDNLKFLNTLKNPRTCVKIFALANNINYLGLKDIIDLAVETKCDAIEFGVPDVIPGITDSYLLNKEQLKFLKNKFVAIVKDVDNTNHKVRVLNKDIFLSRISNDRACYGEYDSPAEKKPCYIGWLFLRLRANGDFNSCLKSHRIPIGNIYKDSIFSVWNNALQQDFREKALTVPKDKEYFKFIGNGNGEDIGCKRMCDNILINRRWHNIGKYLFWI